MRHGLKVAVAAGFVGAVTFAAAAFGQTGTPSPTPGAREQRKLERRADQEQRKAQRQAQGNECGKAAPRAARAVPRVVHSESKVAVKGGFAVVVLDNGTITAVNPGASSVTIKRADGESVTVTASDQTKVCRDGKKVTVDQLKAGDRAGISQVTRDGEHHVRAIRAHSPNPSSGTSPQKRPALADEDLLGELSA